MTKGKEESVAQSFQVLAVARFKLSHHYIHHHLLNPNLIRNHQRVTCPHFLSCHTTLMCLLLHYRRLTFKVNLKSQHLLRKEVFLGVQPAPPPTKPAAPPKPQQLQAELAAATKETRLRG